MTKRPISFAAALGFLAVGLVAAVPATAGSLSTAKPTVTADRHADLYLVDRGSWKKKHYFKNKKRYFKNKKHYFEPREHYRGDHYYGEHDDRYYKHRKRKKKFRNAYRHGYDRGYHEGRRDSYYDRDYYYGKRPHYRKRGHHHRDRYGNGYIKAPGFYFRF
jgi:hypothetical protein